MNDKYDVPERPEGEPPTPCPSCGNSAPESIYSAMELWYCDECDYAYAHGDPPLYRTTR
ncbi:zf-TFIIB domain-containing protein [Deinococcus peraridilitoris]|uniref:Uncharacterized protein n=1 Tax=Deinococcus peraridilitoris (strain DSM 19664 / LMG 22246 / CIP 109416 / KR-200) TaxID=937777 RepID=L0A196_DEIPD|nr:zf-TFIIB domain-containing protein [Deinococcus peraridilitoris]AFZ67591.1 hypothetical protein Deipe_2096 [Deinococcus peraridilitoris DSM 19664]